MAARPVLRRAPVDRPSALPAHPPVRDFSGASRFAIEWDVRPVYDFLFSLSEDAGASDDLPAADRRWLADARASLPEDVRASVGRLFDNELAIHVAAFAVDRPDVRTSADFVEAIRDATPLELIRTIFVEAIHEADLGHLVEQAVEGDAGALAEVEARLPDWRKAERIALLRDPEGTARDLIASLEGWAGPYATIEGRIGAILERDHEARTADRNTLRPDELIERTTGGIRWLPEPGVRRVILAPSYFSRPFNFLLSGDDWRFFGYPVADAALDEGDALAAPPAVIRLHRALGDETRLKILKLLAGRDLYLTEIAQQLELSKPTIKHHLALLRAAGLVTVTEAGTVMYYSLRHAPLDDASTELKRFLVGTGAGTRSPD